MQQKDRENERDEKEWSNSGLNDERKPKGDFVYI